MTSSALSNVDLTVVVGDNQKDAVEYQHEGRYYIEGKEGSVFALRVRNRHPFRVKVVLSVDQVNVVNGQPATGEKDETGYILNAGESQTVLGYRLDDDSVARFKFTKTEGSYAQADHGLKGTTGVIGCRVWREKEAPVVKEIHHHHDHWRGWWYDDRPWWSYPNWPIYYGGNTITVANLAAHGSLNTATANTIGATYTCNAGGSASSHNMAGVALSACSAAPQNAGMAQTNLMMNCSQQGTQPSLDENPFSLGSTFGAKVESKVTSVTFVSDTLVGELAIYFAPRAGLIALGVDVNRKPKVAFPQAFSGAYAKPPKGWVG